MADRLTPPADPWTAWQALEGLKSDLLVGPAVASAFEVLWIEAGGRPNEIVITAEWLGRRRGASPRAAHKWLKALTRHGLVEVIERDPRRGSIRLYVLHPNPSDRVPRPDPQLRLALPEPMPADGHLAPGSDRMRRSPAGGGIVGDPPGPTAGSDLCALKGPSLGPLGMLKGPTGDGGKIGFAAETRKTGPPASDLCALKGPSTHCNKEKKETFFPRSQRNQGSTLVNRLAREGCAAVGVGELLPAAIAATAVVCDPALQRTRLIQRITAVVGPDLSEWVAGSAANLVIYHGVPMADLENLLASIEIGRRARTLRSAPAAFHAAARKLAGRYGKPWPRKGEGRREKGDGRTQP